MNFHEYQRDVVRYIASRDTAHEMVAMLGIGANVGELLLAQQHYLRDSVIADTNKGVLARHLGTVLRWAAVLAESRGMTLTAIADSNLRKVDKRARALGYPGVDALPDAPDVLSLDAYQDSAAETDQEISAGVDPLSLTVPMLGLAGEAGNLLVEVKKRFRRDSGISDWGSFISEELGDLLWYIAAVARHLGIRLDDVAEGDLQRLALSAPRAANDLCEREGTFDGGYPATEQLPRRLHLQFRERWANGQPTATMTLLEADPNAFPDGPIARGDDKFQGFAIGKALGDEITDNSRRGDAYRYHDAIHLGFLAVLGWSPNLRGLLRVKRKSDSVVDETEDGARAIFAEEGVAAILAKQALASRQFETPNLVPDALLDIIATVVEDLEVAGLPYWMWREAISQGFTVMRQLVDGSGGYVLADLDGRTLQYSKFPFAMDDRRSS